MLKLRL